MPERIVGVLGNVLSLQDPSIQHNHLEIQNAPRGKIIIFNWKKDCWTAINIQDKASAPSSPSGVALQKVTMRKIRKKWNQKARQCSLKQVLIELISDDGSVKVKLQKIHLDLMKY